MKAVKNFFNKVKGDDKLVVSLVLIAIAIGLCFIFRNQINQLMTTLFQDMTSAVKDMYSGGLTADPNLKTTP